MDFDNFDKTKRQQRFRNKNRRDAQKHTRQINREKATTKTYRRRFDYDHNDYSDEDWENEWNSYDAD